MNLQLLRNGITRLTGLAFMFSVLGLAQAQVATHTQLTSTTGEKSITFTANVSDSLGSPVTNGIVTLENAQGASLGSAFVRDGAATLTLDQQLSGSVYAVYSGSQDFRSSTAHAQITSHASTLPDFSITANPTSVTVSPGQYGTIVITITPLNGFDQMVTLSCSGNPAASACTFSPTTVTPLNGNPVTTSLQITTQGVAGAKLAWPGHASHTAYAIVLPGLLALAGLGALRKRCSGLNAFSVFGLAALLTASTLGLTACAQRYDYLHHPPVANPGIAAGTYTIIIAAYSNNGASVTSHTLNVTLTVS
jgi:hypothetical protein